MIRLYILFLFIPMFCLGQNKLEGTYYNHFGDTLIIFESSYGLSINIDQYSNSYKGTLNKFKDTIYLDRVLDMNSLRRHHSSYSSQKVKDSLLNLKNEEEEALSSKHQWRFRNPSKFLRKNDTLYLINSTGEIDKRKFHKEEKNFGTYFIKRIKTSSQQ